MSERGQVWVWGQLALISTMWGSAFLLMKVAVDTVPPFLMAAARGLLAAAILAIVLGVFRRNDRPRPKTSWVPAIVLGTLSGWLPNVLTAWALVRIDSSLAGMLSAVSPILTAVLAHFVLRNERLRPAQATGVIVGFLGVVLIIGVDSIVLRGQDAVAQLAMVAVSLSYAMGTVYARRVQPEDPPVVAQRQQLVAGLAALPLALILEQPWDVEPDAVAVAAVVALAVFASALPVWLWFRLIRTARAVTVSLVAYLMPVVAIILGWLVLDEVIEFGALVGLSLVFLGVWMTGRSRDVPGRLAPMPRKAASGPPGAVGDAER